jgi:hypothetical protein
MPAKNQREDTSDSVIDIDKSLNKKPATGRGDKGSK